MADAPAPTATVVVDSAFVKSLHPELLQPAAAEPTRSFVLSLAKHGITAIRELAPSGSGGRKLPIHALRKLDVSHNELTRLLALDTVPLLTVLTASNNRLVNAALQADLTPLTSLVVLNVAHNRLSSLPRGSSLTSQYATLQALIANDNRLTCVDGVCALTALNTLILSRNRLTSLPPRLDALTHLQKLAVAHNELTDIPRLDACTALVELRINNNRMTALPEALRGLPQLRLLDAGGNDIDTWEGLAPLAALTKLKNLNLKGNPVHAASVRQGKYVDRIKLLCSRVTVLDGDRLDRREGGAAAPVVEAPADAEEPMQEVVEAPQPLSRKRRAEGGPLSAELRASASDRVADERARARVGPERGEGRRMRPDQADGTHARVELTKVQAADASMGPDKRAAAKLVSARAEKGAAKKIEATHASEGPVKGILKRPAVHVGERSSAGEKRPRGAAGATIVDAAPTVDAAPASTSRKRARMQEAPVEASVEPPAASSSAGVQVTGASALAALLMKSQPVHDTTPPTADTHGVVVHVKRKRDASGTSAKAAPAPAAARRETATTTVSFDAASRRTVVDKRGSRPDAAKEAVTAAASAVATPAAASASVRLAAVPSFADMWTRAASSSAAVVHGWDH